MIEIDWAITLAQVTEKKLFEKLYLCMYLWAPCQSFYRHTTSHLTPISV